MKIINKRMTESLAEEEVEEVDPQDCCCYTQDQAVARAAVYVRSLDDNDD